MHTLNMSVCVYRSQMPWSSGWRRLRTSGWKAPWSRRLAPSLTSLWTPTHCCRPSCNWTSARAKVNKNTHTFTFAGYFKIMYKTHFSAFLKWWLDVSDVITYYMWSTFALLWRCAVIIDNILKTGQSQCRWGANNLTFSCWFKLQNTGLTIIAPSW